MCTYILRMNSHLETQIKRKLRSSYTLHEVMELLITINISTNVVPSLSLNSMPNVNKINMYSTTFLCRMGFRLGFSKKWSMKQRRHILWNVKFWGVAERERTDKHNSKWETNLSKKVTDAFFKLDCIKNIYWYR